MADENKPAFYPRVGNIKAKNFKPAKPMPFIDDERAMEIPQYSEFIPKLGTVDLSVPTKENRELNRRITQRDADLMRQVQADRSPLEKLAGGIQAGRFMGSALTQAVNSLPTRIAKGDEAADKFIEERIYKPEQPLAYEYAQDIGNFLEKLETDYKIPPLMPEAVALQYLTGPAASQAKRMAGKGIEQAGMAVERSMEPVVRGALEHGGLPREMALAMGANTQSNVMKPVGGNWIPGELENAVKHLKRNTPSGNNPADMLNLMRDRYTPEEIAKLPEGSQNHVLESMGLLERDVALNNWVDSNLSNYLKKQLGTEKDPVRMLADEGITHYSGQGAMRNALDTSYEQFAQNRRLRKKLGMPEEPMAKEPLGRIWEEGIDSLLDQGNMPMVKQLRGGHLWDQNPWLEKLPPDTTLYRLDKPSVEDMNLQHIMDVLREDLASGRIKPEDVKNISMDRAVRRTHEYNLEMAEKLKDAKAKKLEQMTVYKDYPDQGYKWVQLEKPGDFAAESDAMGHSVRGYEPYKGHPDWAEGSGDRGSPSYGLGGWEAIKRGDAKIYSLIDKKGEPHATVEVGSDYDSPAWYQKNKKLFESDTRIPSKNGQWDNVKLLHRWYNDNAQSASDYVHGISKYLDEAGIPYVPAERTAPKIHQIKGKSNAAPNENYLPYVQDFVKSGNWDEVGDLKNTGLHKLGSEYLTAQEAESKYKPMVADALNYLETHPSLERHRAARRARNDFKGDTTSPEYRNLERQAGENIAKDVPYTYAELKALLSSPEDWTDHGETIYTPLSTALGQIEKAKKSLGPLPPTEGMKRGGKVSISSNPDTMMLEVNNQKMKNGEPAYGAGKLVTSQTAKAAKVQPPIKFPVTRGPSIPEIRAMAERMAPQVMGEFVRAAPTPSKPNPSESVVGKSRKQFEREKTLPIQYQNIMPEVTPGEFDYAKNKGALLIGTSGDVTPGNRMLLSIDNQPLSAPVHLQAGPEWELYNPSAWAASDQMAKTYMKRAEKAAEAYGAEPYLHYHKMTPDANWYAMHHLNSVLGHLRPEELRLRDPKLYQQMVEEIRTKDVGFGKHPEFEGFDDPLSLQIHAQIDPNFRRHLGAIFGGPKFTERYGLNSGQDVLAATSLPELRDLEAGSSGYAIVPLDVKAPLKNFEAESHTYDTGFPKAGPSGRSKYPSPYQLIYRDTLNWMKDNPSENKSSEFGRMNMIVPKQQIDNELIEAIGEYQRRMKELTGKKEGGAIKKPAAYIDGSEFWEAAKKYGIKDSMDNLNKIVDLVNKGWSVDDAARQVADTGMHKAAGGAITGDDLIIEERPL